MVRINNVYMYMFETVLFNIAVKYNDLVIKFFG